MIFSFAKITPHSQKEWKQRSLSFRRVAKLFARVGREGGKHQLPSPDQSGDSHIHLIKILAVSYRLPFSHYMFMQILASKKSFILQKKYLERIWNAPRWQISRTFWYYLDVIDIGSRTHLLCCVLYIFIFLRTSWFLFLQRREHIASTLYVS